MNNSTKRSNGSAIIIGASLSGLMTGIALGREGLNVTILDKAGEEPRSGSGLQVNGGTFDLSKTARLLRNLASGGKSSVQLWSTIESRLRTEALSDPQIDIRYNTRVESVDQDDQSAWVVTQDNETIHADILIGADGHRSLVRRHVAPDNPDATYAGYIVWIVDTMNEDDLPENIRPSSKSTGVSMFHGGNGFMFGSIIDNQDGDQGTSKRQIGSAWYDNSRSDLLRELGCVKGTTVHHSLKGRDIPEETINELTELAYNSWPEPWLSATLSALETRGLTGIPIKEYAPDKLTSGRVTLIGDAAHVPAPITASGFNESLQDAVELGKCVARGVRGDAAYKALEKYESARLNKVRQMVQSGQSFGWSFGRP